MDHAPLYSAVEAYFRRARQESRDLPHVRQSNLRVCASILGRELRDRGRLDLMFICTHNSRRSQMSQLLAQALAHETGLRLRAYSGGSEATAVSPAAARSLVRAGFVLEGAERFRARYAEGHELALSSKRWDDPANPRDGFVTITNCARVEESCPSIPGSHTRLALLYDDPRRADETPEEATVYDATRDLIARELASLIGQLSAT
jgi:arsenate reductase (thioredoxin)